MSTDNARHRPVPASSGTGQPRPAVFTDIDGTLCFHSEAHGIKKVRDEPDGLSLVYDPQANRTLRAHDVSASTYQVFLAEETRALAHRLRLRHQIILVTAARPRTIESRAHALDFGDWFILENGGVIMSSDGRIDQAWQALLEPERRALPEIAGRLQDLGWTLDDDGRTSAIRIRLRDNPGRSAAELDALHNGLDLPSELKLTRNLDNLDIVLRGAGKANAVRYLMESQGIEQASSIGIGDDINDLELLQLVATRYVLASAYPEVLSAARQHSWNISRLPHFDGINEILRTILSSPKARQP